MKKLFCLAISIIAATQFSFTPAKQLGRLRPAAASAAAYTSNEIVDFAFTAYIPCTGESVYLEGQLHLLNHITINGNTVVVKSHAQPQNVSGVETVSGAKYVATGVTQDIYKGSLQNGQSTYTYINNFRIIGQGPGNNYLVHQTVHTTVNANGVTTSVVDDYNVACQ